MAQLEQQTSSNSTLVITKQSSLDEPNGGSAPNFGRAQTPSASGPEISLTNEAELDEEAINRDRNYRPSIVKSDIKHDDDALTVSIDRYGFPVDTGKGMEDDDTRRRRLRKENERLTKWQKMLYDNKQGQMHTLSTVNMLDEQIKQWNVTRNHKKLKSRIRKGIPHQFRATVWQNLAGARELQKREQKKHGKRSFYNELVRKDESPHHEQLWKDINRTYRKQVRFGMVGVKLDESKQSESKQNNSNSNANSNANGNHTSNGTTNNNNNNNNTNNNTNTTNNNEDEKQSSSNLQTANLNRGYQDTSLISTPQDLEKHATDAQMQLYNVLKAFALYRTDIGYCQGMQSVTALMLMMMTEEEAFWMLAALADDEKFRMELLWHPDMPAIMLRFFQMERLVMLILPKLSRHFKQNGIINASMYQATQWFVTVFLATEMQFETVLRVWDIYLNEGLKTIFRMGIGFLKYYEKELLNSDNLPDMIEIIRQGHSTLDTEKYIDTCFSFKITHAQLSALERQYNKLQENPMM